MNKKILKKIRFSDNKVDTESVLINEEELNNKVKHALSQDKWLLMVVVGTKPDFYKQYSLLFYAQKYDVPVILATTGQHYDEVLGYGLKEFNMKPAVDLVVRGDLLQKATEMLYKVGSFGKWLKKKYPNLTVLPIPHGDTLSAAIVSAAWFLATRQGGGQNEAGLRGMSPKFFQNKSTFDMLVNNKDIDISDFVHDQWNDEWFVVRNEPYPEQWDTFVSGAGASYLFAPHEINKRHLLSEGYPEERIRIVGNSVVDAIELVPKPEVSIFDLYPELDKYDDWIRVDIHRRGNLVESRFKAITEGIIELVKMGEPIVWVELVATKNALEFYNMREKIVKLSEQYDNFLFTPLWKSYGHVIEFWKSGKCFAEFTDSGSIQEELNEIQDVLTLTARVNTDRPETIFDAHSNVLIPPISGKFIAKAIKEIKNDNAIQKTMRTSKKIYGEKVGEKIIKWLIEEMEKGASTFQWAHQRLWKINKERSPEYL